LEQRQAAQPEKKREEDHRQSEQDPCSLCLRD
jgi:hypothetical protein